MLKVTFTRDEFVDGWDLAWVLVPRRNIQGGDKSAMPYAYRVPPEEKIVDYSEWTGSYEQIRQLSDARLSMLAAKVYSQFTFAEQFNCETCGVNSSTLEALGLKWTLLALAYEKSGINTWITKVEDKPHWWQMDFFDSSILQADAWGRLSRHLLETSWANGKPEQPTIELIQKFVTHCESGLFGLKTKKSPPSVGQSQKFLELCNEFGLFAPGDPGPGDNLFGDALPPSPSADGITKVVIFMVKVPFERPARPKGWTAPIATFQLRCANCGLNANQRYAAEISNALELWRAKGETRVIRGTD